MCFFKINDFNTHILTVSPLFFISNRIPCLIFLIALNTVCAIQNNSVIFVSDIPIFFHFKNLPRNCAVNRFLIKATIITSVGLYGLFENSVYRVIQSLNDSIKYLRITITFHLSRFDLVPRGTPNELDYINLLVQT